MVKEPVCNAGDLGWIPGEGNDYPLQYSCLENFMDRVAWQATVHEVTESDTTEQVAYTSPPSDMSNKYLHMLGPQIN